MKHKTDLTSRSPRSARTRIHNYAILARTIDKCRASIDGTLGDYHFDCPLDNMLFSFKGVKSDDFKAKVQAAASDIDIAMWLDQAGTPRSENEVAGWSHKVEEYKPFFDPEKSDWFVKECEALHLDPQQTTLFDYLEADDSAIIRPAMA